MELLSPLSCLPFYILATITVVCSLGMIFNRNLVRGGFLLIGAFSAVAGLYFSLAANFVAISQILIYAVGIVLVIIFAIMLTSLKETAADVQSVEDSEDLKPRRMIAGLVSTGLFATLSFVILSQNWSLIAISKENLGTFVEGISNQYTARIGHHMMNDYLLPFELISVLLLIILVGVIILSKKKVDA